VNLFRAWIEFLKKKPRHPEESIPFRLTVALTVLVGIVAACHQLEWPVYGFVVMGLTVAGFVFSYHRRHHSNWSLKAVLSVLMLVALANFLLSLAEYSFDPRIPVAELLLWLQTMHSYDLPARRDLNYSLMVGLVLISLAAVLSHDMGFALYLAAFLALSLGALRFNSASLMLEEAQERAEGQVVRVPSPLGGGAEGPGMGAHARAAARLALLLLAAGAGIYLVLPRFEGMRIRAMPVSWDLRLKLPRVSKGQVINPSYPSTLGPSGRPHSTAFASDNYFGFNQIVDLNLRGALDSRIVMKVRSTEWAYYRGLAFNHYDGSHWLLGEEEPRLLTSATPPLVIPLEWPGNEAIVQIFYIEKELPNVVFVPFEPYQLFFPSEEIYLDREMGLRAPFPLEKGMVYSAMGLSRSLTPRELKKLPGLERFPRLARQMRASLELPDSVPPRVRKLALDLTRDRRSPYEKAMALALHLQGNYAYTLEVPPYPPGAEVADHFLFVERRGYCEQFATSMVVLARAAGLPARYVTGYLPGTYNPFTGFYEVRGTDAHAWAEVLIPGYGWMAFDPSPGYAASPNTEPPAPRRWMISALADYLRNQIPAELVANLRQRQEELGRWAARLWEQMRRPEGSTRILLMAVLSTVGLLGLLGLAGLLLPRRSRPGTPLERLLHRMAGLAGRPASSPVTRRERVMAYYRAMERALERIHLRRSPAATAREFARGVAESFPEVTVLLRPFEQARYAEEDPGEAEEQSCRTSLESLQRRLEKMRAGHGGNGRPPVGPVQPLANSSSPPPSRKSESPRGTDTPTGSGPP
jgi:transglutaminase-like putative cysteine protease